MNLHIQSRINLRWCTDYDIFKGGVWLNVVENVVISNCSVFVNTVFENIGNSNQVLL